MTNHKLHNLKQIEKALAKCGKLIEVGKMNPPQGMTILQMQQIAREMAEEVEADANQRRECAVSKPGRPLPEMP